MDTGGLHTRRQHILIGRMPWHAQTLAKRMGTPATPGPETCYCLNERIVR